MNLRWLHPRRKDVPQFIAAYRPYSNGTLLEGVVVPSRPTRIEFWVLTALAVTQVIAFTVYFALLAASPKWPSVLASATTSIAITAAVVAVMVLLALAARRAVQDIGPWYRQLPIDVLMAGDFGDIS